MSCRISAKRTEHRVESLAWTTANNQELMGLSQAAAQAMIAKHKAEREAKAKAKGRAAAE